VYMNTVSLFAWFACSVMFDRLCCHGCISVALLDIAVHVMFAYYVMFDCLLCL